jgi:DNA-binding beta-propeller fold protein YncE
MRTVRQWKPTRCPSALHIAAALAATAICAAAPVSAVASAGFGALSGAGGCLIGPSQAASQEATAGCGVGKALVAPSAVAVSPDGANVYVASGSVGSTVAVSFGSLAILKRDPTTGAISETGCVSSDGTDGRDGASGACSASAALLGADGVAVAPDGLTVYVSSSFSGTVVAFARNPADGSLTRLGCFQSRPVGGSACPFANIFTSSGALVTSADGRSLYVAAPTVGSISTLTAPAAGSVPAAGAATSAPEATLASIFGAPRPQPLANPCIAVNGFDGPCAVGVAMLGLGSLALSPDGKQIYGAAAASHAVDVFATDATGTLTESSCLKVSPPPGLCHATSLMSSPTLLAISPDGKNVYAADSGSSAGKVDMFARDASTGALSEAGCVDYLAPPKPPESKEEEEESEKPEPEPAPTDPCASVPGLGSVDAIVVSSDGSAVYAIGSDTAVIFSRDAATGKLTETSCADSADSRCTSMASMSGVDGAALSADGREMYVTAKEAGTVRVFGIGAAVTSARVSATTAGLARVAVACPRGMRRWCTGRVRLLRSVATSSGHGRHRAGVKRSRAGDSSGFAIRPGTHASVTIRISHPFLALLLAHRRMRLMAVVLAKPSAGGSGFGRRITVRLGR